MKKLAILIAGLIGSTSVLANVPELQLTRDSGYSDNQADIDLQSADHNDVRIVQNSDGGYSTRGNTVQVVVNTADRNTVDVEQQTTFNEARVRLYNGDKNVVTVDQNFREDVDILVNGGNGNTITSDQQSYWNDTLIQVVESGGDDSDGNTLSVTQTARDNEAKLVLRASDKNEITVNQNYENVTDISLTSSNKNVITLDQAYENLATVSLSSSDRNEIDVDQNGSESGVEIRLVSSSGNRGENTLTDSSGIQVVQSSYDYANISLNDSNYNAVYVEQN
ncbi:hypothetical protein [Vibrio mexicanus]|uniref:hypothetical protein n=1 Tax=Vibrio mexicanus TaxID=1004326 RepID=UPI00063C0D9E|nr:hypothetical protein [Vibrio mexicanus]